MSDKRHIIRKCIHSEQKKVSNYLILRWTIRTVFKFNGVSKKSLRLLIDM